MICCVSDRPWHRTGSTRETHSTIVSCRPHSRSIERRGIRRSESQSPPLSSKLPSSQILSDPACGILTSTRLNVVS